MKNLKTASRLAIVIVFLTIGLTGSVIEGWHDVFDDAFITYRYSQNLANGYGITWNPGIAPTEGYTNFLLVVFLAPFIKFGFDPLLITRILSYLSLLAIAAIIYDVARRKYHCSTVSAFLVSVLILLPPQAQNLCLVGLETVIYALLLLITFHIGTEFLVSRKTGAAIFLGILIVLTMLLRPEAILLYLVMCLLYLTTLRSFRSSGVAPLVIGTSISLAIGILYLAWKVFHFGYVLPNPFYIKADGNSLVSKAGVLSVFSFLLTHLFLFVALIWSAVSGISGDRFFEPHSRVSVFFGVGFILLYAIFFIRTDTLMDIYGRFMFPLLPILIYSSLPALVAVLNSLENRALLFPVLAVSFLLVFSPTGILHAYGSAKRILFPEIKLQEMPSLMQKELIVAKSLSQFPEIKSVRIAFGDAGVIPYYTGSLWLDVVGLNDGVIARERDKTKLVNYFFSFDSDLVIHPGQKNFSWIKYGHGPLGDYSSWAGDPRWDEYVYVGTCKTGGKAYDLQFFVKKTSKYYVPLTLFLKESVIDGRYEPFPYPIGTYIPPDGSKTGRVSRGNFADHAYPVF